jgi:hypothetical protein
MPNAGKTVVVSGAGAGVGRAARVGPVGRDRPEAAQPAEPRPRDDEVVGELVEGPLDAEANYEGKRERDGVG